MIWSYATSPTDAEELAEFFCTEGTPVIDPDTGDILAIEDEWEYEVQTELQRAIIPPPGGQYVLIGRDDGPGIAAACWWGETPSPRYVRLYAVARAARLRGQGVGGATLEEFKDRLKRNAATTPGDVIMVQARVDRSNANSQALLDEHGFVYANNDGWYQQWWLRLEYHVT